MGTFQNHALILNTYDTDELRSTVERVREYAADVTDSAVLCNLIVVVPQAANFGVTVFMAPDGSKEGWQTSEDGDAVRAYFKSELSEFGSIVEVNWGELGSGMSIR